MAKIDAFLPNIDDNIRWHGLEPLSARIYHEVVDFQDDDHPVRHRFASYDAAVDQALKLGQEEWQVSSCQWHDVPGTNANGSYFTVPEWDAGMATYHCFSSQEAVEKKAADLHALGGQNANGYITEEGSGWSDSTPYQEIGASAVNTTRSSQWQRAG